MTAKHLARFGIVLTALVLLSACGNTIRGIGRDTANAVDATKEAAHETGTAIKEGAKDAWDATKAAAHEVKEGAKEVGHDVADTAKKAKDAATDADKH